MLLDFAHTVRAGALATVSSLTNAILPAECRLCALPLDNATPLPICGLCLAAVVPAAAEPSCLRCAVHLVPDDLAAQLDHLCPECRQRPPAFERVVPYGEYEGALRELIHLLKFYGLLPVADLLAAKIASALEPHRAAIGNAVVLTAVPLFSDRQRQRGFNQARRIAESLARQLRRNGWQVTENYTLMTRSRATRSQSELSYSQRRANLRGVFKPGSRATDAANKTILLVDDIVTTAATARHCAAVLRRSGAGPVFIAAAARSQFENPAAAFAMPRQQQAMGVMQ